MIEPLGPKHDRAVQLDEIPADVARKLSKYPMVPATLLGRLAVSSAFRGQGHSATLLMDALYRILQRSREVASAGVIVAAKDAAAFAFYMKYDFSNSQESSDGSSCRWAPWKSYFDRADRTLLVNYVVLGGCTPSRQGSKNGRTATNSLPKSPITPGVPFVVKISG